MSVPTRQASCPNCRRINLRPAQAIVMVCDHCQALVSTDHSLPWLPAGREWSMSGHPDPAERPRLETRVQALPHELHRAPPASAIYRRWLVQEHTALQALLYPHTVLHAYRDHLLERWIEAGVCMTAAQQADPQLVIRQQEMVTATTALATTDDPVAGARALLAAARRHYAGHYTNPVFALVAHRHPAPDDLAASYVRLVVVQYGQLLGKATIERIMVEVLGHVMESDSAACPRCGGVLSAAALCSRRCPRCRNAITVRSRTAWIDEQMTWWPTIAAGCPDNQTRIAAALQWILRPSSAGRDVPGADDVLSFLSRAIPDVNLDELLAALDLARHWASAAPLLSLLDELEVQIHQAARRWDRD